MRSNELSSLAGVTTRTLRHYHQIGVLDEPPRSANGYRQYDVHDLIRVLRIRQLAALGVSLDRMPSLLEDATADAPEMLEQLDTELTTEIERLCSRRTLVAQLRAQPMSPDLPLELAPLLAAVMGQSSSNIERMDRDQTVLLAHLADRDGMASLTALYERLSHPELLPSLIESTSAFSRLGEHTTDDELDTLVTHFVDTFATVIEAHSDISASLDSRGATGLFDEYTATTLNATQRRALVATVERLEAREPRGAN